MGTTRSKLSIVVSQISFTMSKVATIAAIATVASAQTVLPYTPVVASTATISGTVISAPRAFVPPTPPRYLTGPGIQVAGYPTLPAEYDFPFEQTKINTNTGLLVRTAGTPLPPIENLVKYSDGLWYQAPTNSWEYVDPLFSHTTLLRAHTPAKP